MDAFEFVRNYREMLEKRGFGLWIASDENTPEEIVAETEKWVAEHPAKTRQSVFLEQYPEASISKDGTIAICPLAISAAYRGKDGVCVIRTDTCADCRRKFWLAEVEE